LTSALAQLSERLEQLEQEYLALPAGAPVDPGMEVELEQLESELRGVAPDRRERRPATFLQIVNASSYEPYYSSLLAYFLDPNQPHGLGSVCLNALFDVLGLDVVVDERSAAHIDVYTEYYVGSRRADIIVDTGDLLVLIENKVYSGEQPGQTTDLREYGGRDGFFPGREKRYVYLTPDGGRPVSEDFTTLSYRQLLGALEPAVAGLLSRVPAASLVQLGDFLRTVREELMPDEKKIHFGPKSALYLKHYKTIHDVEEGFKREYNDFRRSWQERFPASCNLKPGEKWVVRTSPDCFQALKKAWEPEDVDYYAHFELWTDDETINENIVTAMLDVEGRDAAALMEKLEGSKAEQLCARSKMEYRPKDRRQALYRKDYELKSLEDLFDVTVAAFAEFRPFIKLVDDAFVAAGGKAEK
jgi:hypothetical protein